MPDPRKENNSSDELYARINVLERRMRGLKRDIIGVSIDTESISETDADIFEARLAEAKVSWSKFKESWLEREELAIKSGSGDSFPTDAWYELYDALKEEIIKASGAMLSIKKREERRKEDSTLAACSTLNASGGYSHHKPNLPRISIPTFNGDWLKWSQFRDTYESLIHNEPTLTKVEKFHYLAGSLKGEAAAVISRFPVEERSYDLAWKKVVETYHNPRILANLLVHRIIELDPKQAKLGELQRYEWFMTEIANSIETFRSLQIRDPADFLLATLALRALDAETRRHFELSLDASHDFPTVDSVVNFVRQRRTAIQMSQEVRDSSRKASARNAVTTTSKHYSVALHAAGDSSFQFKQQASRVRTEARKKQVTGTSSAPIKCCLCKGEHHLAKCENFKVLPFSQRVEKVQALKACWNCLRMGHGVKACISKYRCRTCNKRHHTLIHQPSEGRKDNIPLTQSTTMSPLESFTGFGSTPQGTSSSLEQSNMVLLGTARVLVRGPRGDFHYARAVLDSGSQHTFITSTLAQKFGAEILSFKGCISSLGEAAVPKSRLKGSTICTIRSCIGDYEYELRPIIIECITSALPGCDLPVATIAKLMNHPLADQHFGKSGPIDILIGGDLYPRILTGASYPTEEDGLFFTPTKLGLVVSGVVCGNNANTSSSLFCCSKRSIEENLKAFWELEEPAAIDRSNPEDVHCERHFIQTHSRNTDGRYMVRLPFRTEQHLLDDNKSTALRRFYVLEAKFRKDPKLSEDYKSFMKEYQHLGHMSPAIKTSSYLIPHHGIWQENVNGSKLRVVFDASCRSNRHSLNDLLHSGPKLQGDLCVILTRFRLYAVAICTDIVKMYRQIVMHPDDRLYQHILWRDETSSAIQEFELNTVTYGVRSSAYQALRVIKQLVIDEGASFPLASDRVTNDMYVDDIVSGADTAEEAHDLIYQLCSMFSKGGFSLGKWASNIPEVLPCIGEPVKLVANQESDHDSVKILGLFWSSSMDAFSYATLPLPSDSVTKRIMLSAVARIFDPLGFLSPVTFKAKFLIQAVWKAGLDWDDELIDDISEEWRTLTADWQILSSISIPRYISHMQAQHYLIGFCDASSKGYAASLYLRSEDLLGEVKVSLIKSKTKVAPLRFVSIARLELCGALLLARLVSSVAQLSVKNLACFTDSQVVISWLNTPTHELGIFEANRVSQILNSVPISLWRHVDSEDNPADLASRGCSPRRLKDATIWWNGPQWLTFPVHQWLKPTNKTIVMSTLQSVRNPVEPYDWTKRFSSVRTLVRTVARILRFIATRRNRNTSSSLSPHSGSFSAREIAEAELKCIIFIQRMYLPTEFYKEKPSVPKEYSQLSPFIDEWGVVRVGGRLQESSLSYAQKHPILLPRQTHFAKLVIDSLHSDHYHAGPALTLALLRGKYWIPSAAKLIRGKIQRCVYCRIQRAKPITPIMAPLPRSRFEEVRAFSQTGVDYAGPFLIKESRRRNASLGKAYLCLFICLSSKALHLELVSSLTTSSFLASLERFISRRGSPRTIWSDHGTNFVGASKFLKEVFKFQKENHSFVSDACSVRGVEWKFIPPRAPHFGGLWEAGVKSVKRLLASSVGNQPYTFEELTTALAKVEALLNSRPLCPLTEDTTNFDFLTPGHFLIGGPISSLPQLSEENSNPLPSFMSRWKLIEAQISHIWNRWRKEYLHTLQQRKKWTEQKPTLNVGDLVVLLEKRSIVGQWPVARVSATFPGRDGVIRTLTVRTPSGNQLTRAVTSVTPLFFPHEDEK